MKVLITGAEGLLGWHAAVLMHAENCAASYKGEAQPYEITTLNHAEFDDALLLNKSVAKADAILHFAGVNRAPDGVIETANPAIAQRLANAWKLTGSHAHIIYSNSTHSDRHTPYGRSKRIAGEILAGTGCNYTDLVLPHIYGECARPNYNNVTATFIQSVIKGQQPDINPNGRVSLLYAGEAVRLAVCSIGNIRTNLIRPDGIDFGVNELFDILTKFHSDYSANIIPELEQSFKLTLFNCYRAALYPETFPKKLKLNADERGILYEAVKGRNGGQTFLSTTLPGVTRGDHFHLRKVERFLVVKGNATIRLRKVLTNELIEYHVSGECPAYVDMPTLYTHSIENTGDSELLTLFWSNELFDPSNPDTFSDTVLK